MKKIMIILLLVSIGVSSVCGQPKKKGAAKSNSSKGKTTKITTKNTQAIGLGTKTFNGQFNGGLAKYTYYEDPITHAYIKDGLFSYSYTGENYSQTVSGSYTKGLKTGVWSNKFTMKDFRKTDVWGNNERFCTGTVTLVANYYNGYANGNWKEICSYKGRIKYTHYDGSFRSWGNFEPVQTLIINMNFKNGFIVGAVYINDEFKNFMAKGNYDTNSLCDGTWIINNRFENFNNELIYKNNILYEFISRDNSGNLRFNAEKYQENYDNLMNLKSLSPAEYNKTGVYIDTICGEHCNATKYIFEYYHNLFDRDYFPYDGIDGDLSYNESWISTSGKGFTGFRGGCELKVMK